MEEMDHSVRKFSYFLEIVNGRPRKSSNLQEGLRQEDLLSPLIFVLVVDASSLLVEKEISCFRVERNDEEMSHLQFAKDTICFTTKDNQVL